MILQCPFIVDAMVHLEVKAWTAPAKQLVGGPLSCARKFKQCKRRKDSGEIRDGQTYTEWCTKRRDSMAGLEMTRIVCFAAKERK